MVFGTATVVKIFVRNFHVCFVPESDSSEGGGVVMDTIFRTKTV
jgi:hypothetical protein